MFRKRVLYYDERFIISHSHQDLTYTTFFYSNPAGKIAEKTVRRRAFWTIWCILNADSTKIHFASVSFLAFLPAGKTH